MEKFTYLTVFAPDKFRRLGPASLVLVFCASLAGQTGPGCEAHPRPLYFEELMQLATANPVAPELTAKLEHALQQPLLCNGISSKESVPAAASGRALRISEWNINHGENLTSIAAALRGPATYHARVQSSVHPGKDRSLDEQLLALSSSDVLVLDEVDIGVKRTQYRNVVRDLALELGMNYVFGIEFIELNPLYLGAHKMDVIDVPRQRIAGEESGVSPKLYAGLAGTALLSRYPIAHAEIVRLPQKYDWYQSEVDSISSVEKARRWSAEKIFQEEVRRQVRRGGRMALVVHLELPQSPTGLITVVCPHLENYTTPAGRRAQMNFLLSRIETVPNPVVLAGDLNSTGNDATPTSIKREIFKRIKSPRFWVGQVLFFVIPVPGLRYMLYPVNYVRKYHDPTVVDVPVLLSNREAAMFRDLRDFSFADGTKFDLSGRAELSFRQKEGTLANANQRAWKGFAPTFSFRRNWHRLVGSYKLDWMIVKQASRDGGFMPARGRTLNTVNRTRDGRISDHAPITVELNVSVPEKQVRTAGREP